MGLISSVLVLGWGRSHMVIPNDPTLVVLSKSCQSAQSYLTCPPFSQFLTVVDAIPNVLPTVVAKTSKTSSWPPLSNFPGCRNGGKWWAAADPSTTFCYPTSTTQPSPHALLCREAISFALRLLIVVASLFLFAVRLFFFSVRLLVLLRHFFCHQEVILFAMGLFLLPWGYSFTFAVRLFLLLWQLWATILHWLELVLPSGFLGFYTRFFSETWVVSPHSLWTRGYFPHLCSMQQSWVHFWLLLVKKCIQAFWLVFPLPQFCHTDHFIISSV